ncbi:hypothetical protein C3747_19g172 [Trypanosoma cruzi]|uniref:U3 small nucleolar RNA-associated protein 18 n=2 Tax=Trypanosoma cruzi TaxID=5693 RepID=Q4D6S4_TRYCC|nr:hypothetical protein, conserved [Trypanosoma cruzi]EAN88229.1 hypothetical protein, conserved [Trypanosoma cruzi]PWV17243.1 hypothetical protein C3747_19g172 [Trypanosoma cruzi]RNC37558.1 hypothetical protein TcCL_NonESM13270 [Trypanosoma cruzi]|eukprot:XP_810080.1 hypothetical protein [Trypanosoma cruzi strain CL Brener]
MASRAWVDDADRDVEEQLPDFVKQSHVLPAWATVSSSSKLMMAAQKRFRDEDLDELLARTEPLLTSKHDRKYSALPPVLSVLPLPRDSARTVQWHRNGQLAVVGGNHHLYLFNAAGRFVEQLSKTDVEKRIECTALEASGEDVLIVGHQSYTPDLLVLSTEKLIPLKFLFTRDSAVYRNGRRDNGKHDFYITNVALPATNSSARLVGISSGATVTVGSLSSGSVTHRIEMSDPVVDILFSGGPHELTVATRTKLSVFDLRKSAQFLRETCDDGTVDITTFATSDSALAVGSKSGIVSIYNKGSSGPVKILKNLTTSISHLAFGERSNGDATLAYSTKGQKSGFRLAALPECRVVPSFPPISQRHQFIQSLTIAPTIPVLSVGEKQKVTNYAL